MTCVCASARATCSSVAWRVCRSVLKRYQPPHPTPPQPNVAWRVCASARATCSSVAWRVCASARATCSSVAWRVCASARATCSSVAWRVCRSVLERYQPPHPTPPHPTHQKRAPLPSTESTWHQKHLASPNRIHKRINDGSHVDLMWISAKWPKKITSKSASTQPG